MHQYSELAGAQLVQGVMPWAQSGVVGGSTTICPLWQGPTLLSGLSLLRSSVRPFGEQPYEVGLARSRAYDVSKKDRALVKTKRRIANGNG